MELYKNNPVRGGFASGRVVYLLIKWILILDKEEAFYNHCKLDQRTRLKDKDL